MISQLGRVTAEVFWGGLSNMRTVAWSRDTDGLRPALAFHEWIRECVCAYVCSLCTGCECEPEQKLLCSCVSLHSGLWHPCEWIILRHDPWPALNVCFSFYLDVHFLASYLFYLLSWFIQTSLGGVRSTPIYLIFNNYILLFLFISIFIILNKGDQ